MTDEQWQVAWKLYQAADSVPPEQRHSFLSKVSDDPTVRDAVLSMFQAAGQIEGLDRIGQKVGRYVITGRLGQGGMGEVYAARDSELGRTVAMKFLASSMIGTPSSVERFVHEAKAASALNHPNIVTIYEVIHSTSQLAIVMELVDGMALRQLCGIPLPVDRLLHVGEQIAKALTAAHTRGIVHRDIKPENLMIRPDGLVKILDFGLARDMGSITTSTLAPAGTLRYMSPEQSRGEPLSGASDVFSLGIVLYELATGSHPFHSGSVFEAVNAVHHANPPALATRNAFVPEQVDALIIRMLAKNPGQRPSASDVAHAFESLARGESVPLPATVRARTRGKLTPWIAATLLLAGALAVSLWAPWRSSRAPAESPLMQLDLDVGDEVSQLAISSDGSRVAYLSGNQLVLRRLDQNTANPLAGTEGTSFPFFSPDGQWVAFFAGGKLRKIAVNGGAPETICDAQSGRGGSWGEDGRMVVTLSSTGGLFQVSSSGGVPRPLTGLSGEARGVTSHRWPQILPGGKGILFTATIAGGAVGSLRILPQGGGPAKTVVENSPYGRYLSAGYLVYFQGGKLFAVPLNPDRLQVTGPAIPLADRVAADTIRGAVFESSLAGTLLYRRGDQETSRVLSWLDAAGRAQPVADKPRPFLTPRLSPDGNQLALALIDGAQQNLWIYDLAGPSMKRLTFGSEPQLLPVWSPDGAFVVFRSGSALAWVRSDGAGKMEGPILSDLNPLPYSFSPDGKWLLFAGDSSNTGLDLYALPIERAAGAMRPGPPRPILRESGGQYAPAVSPDGRWLAYTSDESGRAEVYVAPFSPDGPARTGKWQVSDNGGVYAVWSQDPRELFYRSADRRIMQVTWAAKGDSFQVGQRREWSAKRLGVAAGFPSFDLAPTGGRAIGLFESEQSKPETHLRVLLNVAAELRRRSERTGN